MLHTLYMMLYTLYIFNFVSLISRP